MRATMHNGRTGADGKAFSSKHNDRNVDLDAPSNEHIHSERTQDNFTFHIYYKQHPEWTFDEAERAYYIKHFGDHLNKQNDKYIADSHPERVKSIDDYRQSKQTCPEEVLFYLGNRNEHVEPDILKTIINKQMLWEYAKFPNVKVLDYALHLDEETPHIHVRKVWVSKDTDGNEIVSQAKALQQMGIDCPDPEANQKRIEKQEKQNEELKAKGEKPKRIDKYTRDNNPKMTYTKMCRDHLLELCLEHGLDIETEPQEKSKSGRKLEDYKARQAEERRELAEKQTKLAELNQKKAENRAETAELRADVAENRLSEATRETEKAQEELADVQAQKSSLEDENTRLKAQMDAQAEDISSLTKQRDDLSDELSQIEKKSKLAEQRAQKAEEREQEAATRVNSLETDITALEDENARLRAKMDEQNRDIIANNQTLVSQGDEITHNKDLIISQNKDISDLTDQKKNLEDDVAKAKDLKKQVKQLRREKRILSHAEVEEIQTKRTLTGDIRLSPDDFDRLLNTASMVDAMEQDYNKRLDKLARDRKEAEKNASQMLAEARSKVGDMVQDAQTQAQQILDKAKAERDLKEQEFQKRWKFLAKEESDYKTISAELPQLRKEKARYDRIDRLLSAETAKSQFQTTDVSTSYTYLNNGHLYALTSKGIVHVEGSFNSLREVEDTYGTDKLGIIRPEPVREVPTRVLKEIKNALDSANISLSRDAEIELQKAVVIQNHAKRSRGISR